MKYKGVTYESSPSLPKYPDMIKVIRTTKKMVEFMNKKFVSEVRLRNTIDAITANNLIEKGRIKTSRELMELGMGNEMNF